MQAVRAFSYSALCGPTRTAVRARLFCTATAAAPAKVPMQLIQELRNRTGAGVTDCKKALEANKSDIALATSWLREKGKLTATKLSNRVAGEGVVAMAYQGNSGVIIEMNSETDFVSRGESFKSLAHKIVDVSITASQLIPKNAIDPVDVEALGKLQVQVESDEPGQPSISIPVQEAITRTITKTKENIKVRRAFGISVDKGVVAGYIHGGEGDAKAGRLGSLVAVTAAEGVDKDALNKLASQLALHIVGLNPKCIDKDSPIVAQELAKAQAVPGAKPNITAEDIAEDVVLLEQKFFSGAGETVRETLAKAGKDVRVHSFIRMAVGEGIEKKQGDFADEVMSMVNQK